MDELDWMLDTWIAGWRVVEIVTIEEAACLLSQHDPAPYRYSNRVLPSEAESMATAIEQAILLKSLKPFAAWAYVAELGEEYPIGDDDIDPHLNLLRRTKIRVEDLVKWCDMRGIFHIWNDKSESLRVEKPNDLSQFYPNELKAAIEAFKAVYNDPTATATRSPKAALSDWLTTNKPELSGHARERISIVANWKQKGGAPKTPG